MHNILCNNFCCSRSWIFGGGRDTSGIMKVHKKGNENIKYYISALRTSIYTSGINIYTRGGFAPSCPPPIPCPFQGYLAIYGNSCDCHYSGHFLLASSE